MATGVLNCDLYTYLHIYVITQAIYRVISVVVLEVVEVVTFPKDVA